MEDDFEKYEAERYQVRCTKCGNIQFHTVSGRVCVKCSGKADKIEG